MPRINNRQNRYKPPTLLDFPPAILPGMLLPQCHNLVLADGISNLPFNKAFSPRVGAGLAILLAGPLFFVHSPKRSNRAAQFGHNEARLVELPESPSVKVQSTQWNASLVFSRTSRKPVDICPGLHIL